jgi:hypothetical protein
VINYYRGVQLHLLPKMSPPARKIKSLIQLLSS